jgi:hypothetical protein
LGNNPSCRKYYPNIEIQHYDSSKSALKAVSQGIVDAHISSEITLSYLIQKNSLSNLRLIPFAESTLSATEAQSVGVKHDNQLLRNILDKALLAVPEEKLIHWRNKWFGLMGTHEKSHSTLSKQQKQWLFTYNELNFHLPELELPLGQSSAFGYQGIAADFVAYLEGLLGTQWLPVGEADRRIALLFNWKKRLGKEANCGNS